MKTPKLGFVAAFLVCTLASALANGSVEFEIHEAPLYSNRISFSAKSSEQGVCKALGFEKAVAGSAVTEVFSRLKVVVNHDGLILRGETHDENNQISKIVCINKKGDKLEKPLIVFGPRYRHSTSDKDEVLFSSESNLNGVCRLNGFRKAALGSAYIGQGYDEKAVVNELGEKTKYVSRYVLSSQILQLICIK